MDILIGLLTLVALTGFVWGVWKLFRKSQRRRGLIYIGVSIGAVMVGGTLAGGQQDRDARAAGFASHEEQERAEAAEQARRATELALARQAAEAAEQERLDALAREQGYESYAAQQAAELAAQRAAQQAALREQLGDFPSLAIKERAEALGISRYAAYRLLNDAPAIEAYCEYSDATYQISIERDAAIDGGADSANMNAQAEAQHEALAEAYKSTFGIENHELLTLPLKGYWDAHCRALEVGWVAVSQDNALDISRRQARQAEDLLKAIYEDQLRNGSASRAFDPGRTGFVTCKRENVADMWFIQCQAKGYSLNSPLHYYVVAWHRAEDYPLLVALNGPTITTWNQIANDAQRRVDQSFAPAIYAGPPLPISDVLSAFQ